MSILYKNPPTFAAIALGSNIGNAEEFFHRACKLLTDNGFVLEAMGPVITTSPVDCPPGTADFSNSALTGYFDRAPEDLLAITQRIEVELGRPTDHGFHDSRTIDLDIVIFGNTVMRTPRLTLPHPRAQERRFVLEPLAEIAPELIFPDTMQSVRATLDMLEK